MDLASISITTELISTANDIKMAIYKNSDPSSIAQSIIETGTHAPRTWNFANLERVMHFYKLLELDSGGNVIGTIIGAIYFLPSNQTFENKPAKLIQAGVTPIPGDETHTWPINVNAVTVPDWVGWQIESFVYPGGIGELKYDKDTPLDLSWNIATGDLELQMVDVVFEMSEYYMVHFAPKIIQSSGGVGGSGGGTWKAIEEINVNTILLLADIGKKFIIKPFGTYLEITLPDYATVPESQLTWFEFEAGLTPKCAAIKTASGQIIQWLEGNLSEIFICPTESFQIYKRAVTPTSFEWRIQNAEGNFKIVGEQLYDDMSYDKVYNKILWDGSILNNQTFARLYDYVLKLPSSQVVPFGSWNGADITTYTKWSYADGSGNFHVPKAQKMFTRNSDGTQLPGLFVVANMLSHEHELPIGALVSPPFGHGATTRTLGQYNNIGNHVSDLTGPPLSLNSGTGLWVPVATGDGSPMHRISRIYCRV
jgi:hypothetical protein